MSLQEIAYGAFGGGLVGLCSASSIAELGERGRQRATTRNEMRRCVTYIRHGVLEASLALGAGGAEELRAAERTWQRDRAMELLQGVDGLGRWRRRQVRRRASQLFGPLTVRMVEALPSHDNVTRSAQLATAWMASQPERLRRDIAVSGALPRAAEDPTSLGAWTAASEAVELLARAVR